MGVSPQPLWLPPSAITPEQVLRHHRQLRGGMGGQAFVPSFIIPVLRISYLGKNISPEPFGYFLYLLSDAGKKICSSYGRKF